MTALTDGPDATWLLNPQSQQPFGSSTMLLAAGHAWDAVRTPEELGLATVERLLADPADRKQLGPVLHSGRSGCLYWIIRPGSTAHYPDGCQLLGATCWIAAPGDRAVPPAAGYWLHLPAAGVLTPAAWLATALHDTHSAPPGGTR